MKATTYNFADPPVLKNPVNLSIYAQGPSLNKFFYSPSTFFVYKCLKPQVFPASGAYHV